MSWFKERERTRSARSRLYLMLPETEKEAVQLSKTELLRHTKKKGFGQVRQKIHLCALDAVSTTGAHIKPSQM